LVEEFKMKKSSIIAIVCIIVILVAVISTYVFITYFYTSMSLKPEVIVTNNDYHQSNFSNTFEEPAIWGEFNDVYGGKYSDDLRKDIFESMKSQASDLGEDPNVLEECLMATGQFDEVNNNRLPCYAEKAIYEYYVNHKGKTDFDIGDMNEMTLGPTEIESCWIIVINWGMGGEPFGHIKTYVISTEDYSVLYYLTCM
jgi:hypothetical protein